jgi:nucleoside-diphosphate-sugar epimerase
VINGHIHDAAMRVLILGCGTVGLLATRHLLAAGHQVIGLRRGSWDEPGLPAGLQQVQGDAATVDWHGQIERIEAMDAVLLAANPGIRRGRDNGVAIAAHLASRQWPAARLVCTGTTSVYGDAESATVAEDGPLAQDDDSRALQAIEAAVLAHGDALVLRIAALVGPTRTHARQRVMAALAAQLPLELRGDPDRPFSWLHEADAAAVAVWALCGDGRPQRGVLNAAAPGRATVRQYYQHFAGAAAAHLRIVGDGSSAPARAIDASRLHRLMPQQCWLPW